MKFKEGDKVRVDSRARGVIVLVDKCEPAPILVKITKEGMVYDNSDPTNKKLQHVSLQTNWWCSKSQLHPFVKLSKGAKAIFGEILNNI